MGPRLMVSMAAVMRNTLALIIPEHGARCVEGGAEKRVSQSMTTMHWELAALRRPEELRGEDGGWMSYFARAETVPGMGPAWQRVWGNKARWDLNKTNKSGCCFTPAWLQLDFRLTSQKRNSFIPSINLSFRLYLCFRNIRETNSCRCRNTSSSLKREGKLWMFVGPELHGISRRHERRDNEQWLPLIWQLLSTRNSPAGSAANNLHHDDWDDVSADHFKWNWYYFLW